MNSAETNVVMPSWRPRAAGLLAIRCRSVVGVLPDRARTTVIPPRGEHHVKFVSEETFLPEQTRRIKTNAGPGTSSGCPRSPRIAISRPHPAHHHRRRLADGAMAH
jgi:hypothetical protein